MNHGSPQQHESHAPHQAWPSFMDGPAQMHVSGHEQIVEPQQAPIQPQQQSPIPSPPQAWGLAAPQVQQQQLHAHAQQFAVQPELHQYSGHVAQQPMHHAAHAPGGAVAHAPTQPAPNPVALPDGTFAFPTPAGMQIVQPPQPGGFVATSVAANPVPAPASKPAAAAKPKDKRMRWEVIVPAGTALVLIAAAFVVFTNFDRITGATPSAENAAQTGASSSSDRDASAGLGSEDAATGAAPEYAPGDIDTAPEPQLDAAGARAAVAKAKELITLGRYDEAKATLAPLVVDGGGTPPVVERMHAQIAAKSKRNDQLLAQLGTQRQAGKWADVLRTLAAIQKLHPLSDAQTKLAATATAKVKAAGGGATSPTAAAKPVKVAGGGKVAKVPSVKRPATAPATPGAGASSGGGASAAGGGSTPPTAVSSGTAPSQPSVANPSSAPSSPIAGQPSGAAADCSGHDDAMVMHAGHC